MSIGCPWARGSFPLAITSKADPAIAIAAIESCLAIVSGRLPGPYNIVNVVGDLTRVPIVCFPILLVLEMLNETSIILRSLTAWIPRTKVRKQGLSLNMLEASSIKNLHF